MKRSKIPLLLTVISMLFLGIVFTVNSVILPNDFKQGLVERFETKDISQIPSEDISSYHAEINKAYESYFLLDPWLHYIALLLLLIALIWGFIELSIESDTYGEIEDKKLIISSV